MASRSFPALPLLVIGAIVAACGIAFAYAAGWLSPERLTPDRMVDAFAPPAGPVLGHRRNHAKGICFTGSFAASGKGAELSTAQVFAPGQYPVVGRFNLGTPDPAAADASVRVRGLSILVRTPDGRQWRSAMIDPPVFPVSTPQAFFDLLTASASKDPNAMTAFAARHPEIATFGAWAKTAPWTASYAETRFNSINSFVVIDPQGTKRTVRWSFIPEATVTSIAPDRLAANGPDALEQDITGRIAKAPARWTMVVTIAEPGDPTADPSKAWPDDRRTVDVGTLTVDAVIPEANGPCRDINFDPTVLPPGITTSDDPFPAARSAAYAKSFDRRTSESSYYPATGGAPQ